MHLGHRLRRQPNGATGIVLSGLLKHCFLIYRKKAYENAAEGTDSVSSSITYTLGANVENLSLTGAAVISGTGNELANGIAGNDAANVLAGLGGNDTLTGLGGNDTLDGGAGADAMAGGAGNDAYVVDNAGDAITEASGEGTDEVRSTLSYTLGVNVENLTLSGTAAVAGYGNEGANVLTGNSGNNELWGQGETIPCWAWAATTSCMEPRVPMRCWGVRVTTVTMSARRGDTVTEASAEGTDSVFSNLSYTLGANLESLTLLAAAGAIDGAGNELANILTGNETDNALSGLVGNDTLNGGGGNDSLDGGAGADKMAGAVGNDIYIVDNAADMVTENASAGTDEVRASVTVTLGANVENLSLTGTSALNGTGNALANVLTGNSAANVLSGLAGNDTLVGGAGADSLAGGTGSDTAGYSTSPSAVNVSLATNTGSGGDAQGDTLSGIENLKGSAFADTLTGDIAANVLRGDLGNDTIYGGDGNDSLDGDIGLFEFLDLGGNDTLYGGAGNDSISGGHADDTIYGEGGDDYLAGGYNTDQSDPGRNVLYGGAGNDFLTEGILMAGGPGNDTYGQIEGVLEAVGEGIDSVQNWFTCTLPANVENLTLIGSPGGDMPVDATGNELRNVSPATVKRMFSRGLPERRARRERRFDTALFSGAVASYTSPRMGRRSPSPVRTGPTPSRTSSSSTSQISPSQSPIAAISIRSSISTKIPMSPQPQSIRSPITAARVGRRGAIRTRAWTWPRVDGLEYIASYGDLMAGFGANKAAGYQHFATHGLFEDRTTTFDGLEYIASYTDVLELAGGELRWRRHALHPAWVQRGPVGQLRRPGVHRVLRGPAQRVWGECRCWGHALHPAWLVGGQNDYL